MRIAQRSLQWQQTASQCSWRPFCTILCGQQTLRRCTRSAGSVAMDSRALKEEQIAIARERVFGPQGSMPGDREFRKKLEGRKLMRWYFPSKFNLQEFQIHDYFEMQAERFAPRDQHSSVQKLIQMLDKVAKNREGLRKFFNDLDEEAFMQNHTLQDLYGFFRLLDGDHALSKIHPESDRFKKVFMQHSPFGGSLPFARVSHLPDEVETEDKADDDRKAEAKELAGNWKDMDLVVLYASLLESLPPEKQSTLRAEVSRCSSPQEFRSLLDRTMQENNFVPPLGHSTAILHLRDPKGQPDADVLWAQEQLERQMGKLSEEQKGKIQVLERQGKTDTDNAEAAGAQLVLLEMFAVLRTDSKMAVFAKAVLLQDIISYLQDRVRADELTAEQCTKWEEMLRGESEEQEAEQGDDKKKENKEQAAPLCLVAQRQIEASKKKVKVCSYARLPVKRNLVESVKGHNEAEAMRAAKAAAEDELRRLWRTKNETKSYLQRRHRFMDPMFRRRRLKWLERQAAGSNNPTEVKFNTYYMKHPDDSVLWDRKVSTVSCSHMRLCLPWPRLLGLLALLELGACFCGCGRRLLDVFGAGHATEARLALRGVGKPRERASIEKLFKRALRLSDAGRNEEAISTYRTLLSAFPECQEARLNLGICHLADGQQELALQAFDEILRLDPLCHSAHYNKGLVLDEMGLTWDALESFTKAQGHAEKQDPESFAQYCCVSGQLLASEQRFAEALDVYDQAIGAVPGCVDAWVNRGEALCGLRRFQEAVASHRRDSRLSQEFSSICRVGEPTEAALRVLVEKLGCPEEALQRAHFQQERSSQTVMVFNDFWSEGVTKRATLEFARDRKSMSVLCSDPEVQPENVLYVKGAPESILDRCSAVLLPDGTQTPLSDTSKAAIMETTLGMAGEALRTLALAVKLDLEDCGLQDYDGPSHPGHAVLCDPSGFAAVEQGMVFVGLVGIIDPPRPECMDAIAACNKAGISVFMTTGDNKVTAEAISRQLGILAPDSDVSAKSLTGKEFADMSHADRADVLKSMMADRGKEGAVFSRMEPKHKQIVVKMLKEQDEIVAMTGDGVNDAPALKQADIGVAMGMGGTEVAKEASDMVLANDNFSTIVAAVEQGRSIFKNMKAVIRYLISSNIGEVASIFLTAALGIPESLAPVQLLWVNLVTDGLPATALGFNPPDEGVMSEPPRRKDDGLISGWALFRYLMIGLYVGIATVGVFIYWFTADEGHTLVSLAQLMDWGHCSAAALWSDGEMPIEPFCARVLFRMGTGLGGTSCLLQVLSVWWLGSCAVKYAGLRSRGQGRFKTFAE
ncbi:unnamed protein product [Effrenium voratum]|nr:unnamed protein product [Effrenium voratum]